MGSFWINSNVTKGGRTSSYRKQQQKQIKQPNSPISMYGEGSKERFVYDNSWHFLVLFVCNRSKECVLLSDNEVFGGMKNKAVT